MDSSSSIPDVEINNEAARQMARDLEDFQKVEQGKLPYSLRTYTWETSCITIGWRQKPEQVLNPNQLEIAKRPTGGGIVFHRLGEFTYCLVLPLGHSGLPVGILESCNFLSQAILAALHQIGIEARLADGTASPSADLCFAEPAAYEIVYKGKKIVGSAQKRGKHALLQQGTFNLELPQNFGSILENSFRKLLRI